MRLNALNAVTLLLGRSMVMQAALGVTSEAAAAERIQGVAPDPDHLIPWIWIDDLGGAPIDRTMGLGWSLKRTKVAIHAIGKEAEESDALVDAIEEVLDGLSDVEVTSVGYTPITVDFITMEDPGDERWEDQEDGVARSSVAHVVTQKNY